VSGHPDQAAEPFEHASYFEWYKTAKPLLYTMCMVQEIKEYQGVQICEVATSIVRSPNQTVSLCGTVELLPIFYHLTTKNYHEMSQNQSPLKCNNSCFTFSAR